MNCRKDDINEIYDVLHFQTDKLMSGNHQRNPPIKPHFATSDVLMGYLIFVFWDTNPEAITAAFTSGDSINSQPNEDPNNEVKINLCDPDLVHAYGTLIPQFHHASMQS